MVKRIFYFTLFFTLISPLCSGCKSDKTSTDGANQSESLPYSWLNSFEKVDSGNRDLEEIVEDFDRDRLVERTVRIEHSSTNIDRESVRFYYDILIVSYDVSARFSTSKNFVKANTFAAEFLRRDGYNEESIKEVPIKINTKRNTLEVGKNYEGVLEIEKDLYEKLDNMRTKYNFSVNINHLMIRQTRSLYSFEI